MKKLVNKFDHLFHAPTLITSLVVGAVIATIVHAAAPPAQPSGEVVILVNSSSNLNAAKLRVVGGKWNIDPSWSNWTTLVTLEAWNAEDPSEIAGRKALTLNFQQMKNLYNAADPSLALRTSALNKANLTLKP